MAKRVKLPLRLPTFHIRVLAPVLATPFPISLPVNVTGKQQMMAEVLESMPLT